MNKASFTRKSYCLEEHRKTVEEYKIKEDGYVVEKTIELEKQEFDSFIIDYYASRKWIKENLKHMWNEGGVWHCLLVTTKNNQVGILIESEGYDYARYTAEIKL